MADKVGLVLPPSRPSPRGRLSRFAPNPHFGFFFFIFCKARRRRAGMCDRREQIPPKRGMADKVGMVLPPTKPSPRRRLSRFAPRGQCSGVSAEFFNLPAALPFSLHNGSRFRISLPLWKEQMCSPSEGELKTWGNCTPSEGGKWRNGRETPLQTLWRTWPGNSPSEGGTISRGNCTPSEGAKAGRTTLHRTPEYVSAMSTAEGGHGRTTDYRDWSRGRLLTAEARPMSRMAAPQMRVRMWS